MPKSKSKSSARVARFAGLPGHPAMQQADPLLQMRLGHTGPVRLPDATNHKTAARVLMSDYTVNSDAAGNVAFTEQADLAHGKFTTDAVTGVVTFTSFVPHTQKTAFEASARLARMVALKIVVTYIGAEHDASGYLSGMLKGSASDITGKVASNLHTGSDKTVKATAGMTVWNTSLDCADFTDPAVAGFMSDQYLIVAFIGTGLILSKPVYRVQTFRYMEYIPIEGDLSEGDTAHEPHNPAALAVHGNLAHTAISFIGTNVAEHAQKFIKEAANAAYHLVQPVAGQYLVGKARNYLAGLTAESALPLMLGM